MKKEEKNEKGRKETGCRFQCLRDPVMYGAKRRRQLSILFTCASNGSRRPQTASSPARNPSIDCTCRCTANPTTPTINDSTNALFASRVFVYCRHSLPANLFFRLSALIARASYRRVSRRLFFISILVYSIPVSAGLK